MEIEQINQETTSAAFKNGQYLCSYDNCQKTYKTLNGFVKHLNICHNSVLQKAPENEALITSKRNSLLLHLFLLRDLADAYRLGDGMCIFRDIKFAF